MCAIDVAARLIAHKLRSCQNEIMLEILYQDDALIAVNKPANLAVHRSKMVGNAEEFLIDQLPTGHNYSDNSLSAIKLDNYKHCLAALIMRTNPKTGACNISREELRVIYEFVIGNMPNTPNKFTSLLKHHRMHIQKVWINNATASGIPTRWVDQSQFQAWLATLQPKLPTNVVPMKKVKV